MNRIVAQGRDHARMLEFCSLNAVDIPADRYLAGILVVTAHRFEARWIMLEDGAEFIETFERDVIYAP